MIVAVGATVVVPAEHLVQMVEVEVITTVDRLLDTVVNVEPPEVWVAVTGHHVVVE